jgi:hypothetical protein
MSKDGTVVQHQLLTIQRQHTPSVLHALPQELQGKPLGNYSEISTVDNLLKESKKFFFLGQKKTVLNFYKMTIFKGAELLIMLCSPVCVFILKGYVIIINITSHSMLHSRYQSGSPMQYKTHAIPFLSPWLTQTTTTTTHLPA